MSDVKDPQIEIMRSQLSRARGMGSAKSGVGHWWAQRVTAVALVPLTLWFIYNLLALGDAPYEVVVAWASGPLTLVLLLTLVGMTFYHMQLGLQVVIEDYVHNDIQRLVLLLLMKGAAVLLAVTAIISILKIGL
jgi:succinate dehydrogenase / fumarate reductase membrane anchor subunit